jgi:serpin B
MKGKDVIDALGSVSENDVKESVPKPKKRKKKVWLAAVAAVLVIAIAVGIVLRGGNPMNVVPVPGSIRSYAVSAPKYPESVPYPASELGNGYDKWWDSRRAQMAYCNAGEDYQAFMDRCAAALLGTRSENTVYSPVSVFLACAMLAELTDGNTRSQLLDALGAQSIESLREAANSVWNANFCNDGATTSLLGSSVWLSDDIRYNKSVLDTLAAYYYAASCSGDFAKKKYVDAMGAWINEQTGDLLADAVKGMDISPETVFTLLSTVLFRAKWNSEFEKSRTQPGIFYAPEGEQTADFMHQTFIYGTYYWGEHFGAVNISFKEGGDMWFFLPDEGISPDELFTDPEVTSLIDALGDYRAESEWENQKSLRVNLSLPKFDVSSDVDLTETLKALNITDCFSLADSDFSPLTEDTGVYVSQVKHAARVKVDEEGVEAAAFTAIVGCGAAMPPEEEMDFVLDRPFAFVIMGLDSVPLFEGTVFNIAG